MHTFILPFRVIIAIKQLYGIFPVFCDKVSKCTIGWQCLKASWVAKGQMKAQEKTGLGKCAFAHKQQCGMSLSYPIDNAH